VPTKNDSPQNKSKLPTTMHAVRSVSQSGQSGQSAVSVHCRFQKLCKSSSKSNTTFLLHQYRIVHTGTYTYQKRIIRVSLSSSTQITAARTDLEKPEQTETSEIVGEKEQNKTQDKRHHAGRPFFPRSYSWHTNDFLRQLK
jgi:hypothetical protein